MENVRDPHVEHFEQPAVQRLRRGEPTKAQVGRPSRRADTNGERSWGIIRFGSAAGEPNMRTFSCFIFDEGSAVPTLSFIFAADEQRARTFARRELMDALRPVSVELCEGGKLVWAEALQA